MKDESPPTLSWPSFLGALGLVLAIFFFLNPIWETRTTDEVDRNIWYSYAPIPLLVLGLLALERKLSKTTWFLETFKLTLVKFGITYVVAGVLWTSGNAPTKPVSVRIGAPVGVADDAFAWHAAPRATLLSAEELGTLEVTVVRADGSPAQGALVFVSAGLERFSFAPPAENYQLRHQNGAFGPGPHIVAAHQELVVLGDPSNLHTIEVRDSNGTPLLNRSLVPGGERRLMFDHDYGLLSAHCRAHGGSEDSVVLAVFAHPFVAQADAQGRVRFTGIPAARLQLSAWHSAAQQHNLQSLVESEHFDLAALVEHSLELTLR